MPMLTRPLASLVLLFTLLVGAGSWPPVTFAAETDEERPVGAVGGAVHADLFTGTATNQHSY